jgi:hypothetical protein
LWAFIERAEKTGALESSTQRGSVIAMKNASQLEKQGANRDLRADR